MKRNLLKTAWGIVLGLALLISAILPVVSAQTRTNAPASRSADAATVQDMTLEKALETRADLDKLLKTLEQTQGVSEQQLDLLRQRLARLDRQIEQMKGQDRQGNTGNVPSVAAVPGVGEEVTIALSGRIDVSGLFVFEGNLVMYKHISGKYPTELSINGVSWEDPYEPFALDFVPDFEHSEMVQRLGRSRMNFYPGTDTFSIRIDDIDPSDGWYHVGIATKIKSRPAKQTKRPAVAEPDENGEISITIDGNIRGAGHFTFEGNTIRYEPRDDYMKNSTMAVTVNGRPWSLLKKPFSLGFTPDFGKAAIVEKQGRKSVMLIPGKDRIELYTGEFDAMDETCHVKIALKNQIPRETPRTVWIATDSPEPAEKPDEPQELRLMLSGSFCNRDSFTFEGNTVRYRNEDGEEARDVAIDYLPWRDLSRPFELDFTPDFDKVSLIPVQELQERTTITLDAESGKFELTLDHAVRDKPYYKFVRLAVKDQVDRRLVRSVRGSAPVQMPIVDGGFGPQPMPNFGFPNMNLDMNGMPKSGRPAFEESNNRTMFPGAAPSRSGAADPAENKEVTLTIEGNFSGRGTFVFKKQSITYQEQKLAYQREPQQLPTDVKVDGVPWDDLSKPFELGYTPDFARAVVLEKVAPYDAGLSRSTTQLQLHVNQPGPPSKYYRLKIAIKDQLRREPEGGFNPFGIMSRTATVDGPTDGMLHPNSAVTRPIYPRDTHDSVRVEVQGTVDRKAGFRLEKGNILVYQNYETDPDRAAPEDPVVLFDGKFASEVTLSDTRDRKAWTNLSVPTMNPSLRSAGPGGGGSAMFSTSKVTHFIFRGEDCDYVYFEHDGVMEIIITNKTDRPAKFQFIMWNGGDNVFEDNDMQYAPVLGPQTKTDSRPSLAPPPPRLSPAPRQGDVSFQNPAPDYSELSGTITLEGDFQGRGKFLLDVGEEQLTYWHEEETPPVNVTVNGKPWKDPDKPFKLGFAVPEQPAMLETEAEGRTNHLPVYMLSGDPKKHELLIHESDGPRHYRVVIGTSEHIRQRQALIREINARIRDILITVEGKLDAKDAFVFEGNTVRFRPSGDRYPDKLTVNAGMQWPVPDKPFELYLAPDFSKEVTVQGPVGSFTKKPADKDRFEITLGEVASSDVIPASMQVYLKFTVLRDNIPRSPNAVNPPAPAVPPEIILRQSAAAKRLEEEEKAARANDVFLTFEATIDKPATLHFEGNTVEYVAPIMFKTDKPVDATINGKPWKDVAVPFVLDFTPDYSHSYIREKEGRGPIFPTKNYDGQYEVFLNDFESGGSKYKVTIAVGPHAPEKPAAKPVTAAQAEIEAAASAAAGLPAGKFPTILNGPMMITSIKEPTDGMDHPDYAVTSPVRAPRFRPEEKIVVKGTVAMEAGFRIQGDRLYYLNFYAIGGAVSGSNLRIYDGRFASGVTVNGKPWTNLTRPFGLDVSLTPTTGKYIGFKAEHCEYDYQFHHDFIEIRITNKKREPAPFELTLWLMENPAAQEKPEAKEQQKPIANAGPVKIRGGLIPVEDDFTDGRKTTRGDFHYNGLSDVIYVKKEADGIRLEYGLDGVNDLEEQETGGRKLLDPAFRFLGGYDMDKDHRVDTVAWRAVENDSGKHIEVGYGKSGCMDEWHVIGMLGVPDGVEWDLYCGNLSGHWDRNSILWHSPSLGTMGYWPDGKGVESWITIPGEYRGPEWKILGLCDFTGAKKPRDSVLLRYGTNTIATVSADGKYTNLGWLDEDWKVVAVDDFSNDGCDDLILFNETLRQVGKWDDGKISKWSSIGFVEEGTAIEGAGDYDGDGWTDLLVRQPDGAMGYFPKADLNKFVPFGYKKDPSWTVIP